MALNNIAVPSTSDPIYTSKPIIDSVNTLSAVITILTFLLVYRRFFAETPKWVIYTITQKELKDRAKILDLLEDFRELLGADKVAIGLVTLVSYQNSYSFHQLTVAFEATDYLKKPGFFRKKDIGETNIKLTRGVLAGILDSESSKFTIIKCSTLTNPKCLKYLKNNGIKVLFTKKIENDDNFLGIIQIEFYRSRNINYDIINTDVARGLVSDIEQRIIEFLENKSYKINNRDILRHRDY
jgi:hypothetical protein